MKAAKPPKPVEKRLITRNGFTRMAAEHDELLLVERPKVVEGIATAAAEGDRSENAEYIYGKKRLRELDKRLRYLGMLLKDVKIVDPDVLRGDTVCFGSTVTVLDDEGVEKTYTIVGEGEAEWRNKEISYKSPVARAVLGKKIGDVITAHRPAGDIDLEITDLKYNGRPWNELPKGVPAAALKMPAVHALPELTDDDDDGQAFADEDEDGGTFRDDGDESDAYGDDD